MIKFFKKLFKKKKVKNIKQSPEKVVVPVYVQNPQPEAQWGRDNCLELVEFLDSDTGRLMIELMRVRHMIKMSAAVASGEKLLCGDAHGFGDAVDAIESLRHMKEEAQSKQDFRVRTKWGVGSNIVINSPQNDE